MEILIKKVPSLASISKFFKPENESWLENFKSVFAKAFNSIKFFGTFSTILIFVFDKFSNLYTFLNLLVDGASYLKFLIFERRKNENNKFL